jgi:acetolactate decarboxylase
MRLAQLYFPFLFFLVSCSSPSIESEKTSEKQFKNPEVFHRGAVKKVHRENDFSAHVKLDTLNPENLYAIGPVEGLDGEFFIMGDRGFIYRLDTTAQNTFTDKNWQSEKAAFLVWSYVEKWDTLQISDDFKNQKELESIIAHHAEKLDLDTNRAFPFMAWVASSTGKGHVMNEALRLNSENRGHSDAKFSFGWSAQPTQMLGFFSPVHAGVFTHHGDRLHIHFRLGNKYQGGHVDAIEVADENWMLLLPSVD